METENIQNIENESPVEPKDVDYKDMYLRLYADMENLKKRLNREKSDSVDKMKIKMMESILDMDNDLSIAIKNLGNDIPEGVSLIIKKIQTFLKSHGVEEICVGSYDPDIHEVISIVEMGEDKIVDVVSKGYRMDGRIIRHPKIILSR